MAQSTLPILFRRRQFYKIDHRVAERLSEEELRQIRQTVEWLSRWMDTAFELPLVGWRFGLDSIVGLVPGVGDAATSLVSFYILALASRASMSRATLARMVLNIGIDFVLGSLPVVGDLFDVWWKSNQMNAALLAERLAASQAEARRCRRGDRLFVATLVIMLVAVLAGTAALAVLAATAPVARGRRADSRRTLTAGPCDRGLLKSTRPFALLRRAEIASDWAVRTASSNSPTTF